MIEKELRSFQKKFIKEAFRPEIDTAVLSLPRGNGKTALAAHILRRCLTIGDPLCKEGSEYLLCAASIEQARLGFRFIRQELGESSGYRFIDSATRIGITHLSTNTRLRVLSSNGKTSMGIVGCPLLVADEPGSWEVVGGQLMSALGKPAGGNRRRPRTRRMEPKLRSSMQGDALETALGKPGSPLSPLFTSGR